MSSSEERADHIAGLLAALREKDVDHVPEGWYTTQEFAQAWGTERSHAGAVLRRAVKAGLMECRKFRADCGNRVSAVKHYRPV